MTKQQATAIVRILENAKGDDSYRARTAFRNCTAEEMQRGYGDSGKTRQEILDGYIKHDERIEELIDAVNAVTQGGAK